ncbi:MAG: SDR family oxidoreductase [Gemmatimonadaceae bacterium]
MTSRSELAGGSAVVTGASRGIGLAVAQAFVTLGLRVALVARSADALGQRAAALGSGAMAFPCDLTSVSSVELAVSNIRAAFGIPDILVSCAGIFPLASVAQTSGDEFALAMQTNLVGPFRLLHAFAPAMRERGRGHIVTVGSVADRTAYPENAAYAASKFGARAVHEVLREELRGSGVRTTLVSPGPVNTSIWDAIDPDHRPGFPSRSAMLVPQDVSDAVVWAVTRPAHVNVDELRLTRA